LDLHAEDASAWGPFCGELDDIAIDPYLEFEGSFLRTTTTYPVVVLLVKARGRIVNTGQSQIVNTGNFIISSGHPTNFKIRYEHTARGAVQCKLSDDYLRVECA
jgi:hypothetical protein